MITPLPTLKSRLAILPTDTTYDTLLTNAILATAGVAVRIVDAVGRADQLVRKACIGSHHGILSLVIVTS